MKLAEKSRIKVNNMKRFLSVLLAALLLSLASCSDASEKIEENQSNLPVDINPSEAETDEEEPMPDLPERNWDGDSFVFISPILTGDMADANTHDIFTEEANGEGLNDSVFNRNLFMTDACGVVIEEVKTSNCAQDIKKSVAASDRAYDVSYALAYDSISLARTGNYLNWRDLDYIDFRASWWDRNAASSLLVGKKLCIAVNDIMLANNDATSAVLFNKQLLENYGFKDNMYDVVREQKWSFDKVSEMASLVYNDIDGNGVMDQHDLYGFMGYRDAALSLFHSSGGRIVSKNKEGELTLTLMREKTYDALIGALTLMAQEYTFNLHKVLEPQFRGNIYPMAEDMFRNDQSLFYWVLTHDIQKFRDMESDFGILPVPAMDPVSSGYACNVNSWHAHLMGILTTADPDQAAYVVELMAAKSHWTVQKEYYDVCLTRKYSRDEDSREMLDLIFGNRVYDVGAYYQIGGFTSQINSLTMTDDTNVASMYASGKRKAERDIASIIEDYEKID